MSAKEETAQSARQKISAWSQYLYFLRFSIIFWFFLPMMILLDYLGYTTSITRAFMAPNSPWQATQDAFFVVALGMIVLITTRNFCMNGLDRFGTQPPYLLRWLFCSPAPKPVWWALFLAHIPTLITLIYLGCTAMSEREHNFPLPLFHFHARQLVWLYLAAGVLLGGIFWYVVSLFYYWTYTDPSGSPPAAKPLIFPEPLFGDLHLAPRPILARWLEWPLMKLLFFTHAGFAPSRKGPLWELHFLSFVSLIGFFLLYIFLYPLTAPVPRGADLHLGASVACILAALFIAGIVRTPTQFSKWVGPIKYFFIALAISVVAIFIFSAHQFIHGSPAERALPVLATILVICSFILWAVSGVAFLLDRYRIPVLTTLLFLIFIPKVFHWTQGEHYYSAVTRSSAPPPSPAQALALRTQDPNDPLIIVSATGGGIHAAVWTTEILGRLEESFSNDPSLHAPSPTAKPYNFHDHVLLASGVSGGSVGLMSYLLEFTAQQPFDPQHPPTARMNNAAACSSIEDVAWGLEYYDLVRLLTNFWLSRPGIQPPDRNWALTEAFNRNLNHPLCHTSAKDLPGLQPLTSNANQLTLGKAADLLEANKLPAFVLNTTAVETGGRFLLSNYQIPKNFIPGNDLLPAESFLHAYGEPCESDHHRPYADLPIATAARLSATFPLVSSASRVPALYADHAYHFVDGGYYDNDGTASVIEFVNAALASAKAPQTPIGQDPCLNVAAPTAAPSPSNSSALQTAQPASPRPPLAILLIEIRNGDDLDPMNNEDDYDFQTHPKDKHNWNAISQLTAPANALWQAGHVSVTRRNRLGLCLLESANVGNMVIHHIIFNFDPASSRPDQKNTRDVIQPLNWHLTAGQRQDIHEQAVSPETTAAIDQARDWVRTILNRAPPGQPRPAVPSDDSEACHIAYVRVHPQQFETKR
ncbi:hypothetical protein [Granulicella sp. dw_53]|uniref:hypothetical protein n=1 Tax=Granulicella sp. dw_53 TaxID=2719792 RepID=UPI001BD50119|nr:hypothetical protein [Granulicella sp. dw_53]